MYDEINEIEPVSEGDAHPSFQFTCDDGEYNLSFEQSQARVEDLTDKDGVPTGKRRIRLASTTKVADMLFAPLMVDANGQTRRISKLTLVVESKSAEEVNADARKRYERQVVATINKYTGLVTHTPKGPIVIPDGKMIGLNELQDYINGIRPSLPDVRMSFDRLSETCRTKIVELCAKLDRKVHGKPAKLTAEQAEAMLAQLSQKLGEQGVDMSELMKTIIIPEKKARVKKQPKADADAKAD